MNRLRVLVVDDEPLARKRIRSLLADNDDIDVIGECADGREAIQAIDELKPDLVFLDIQMPEVDGFGVVEAMTANHRPAIVFVTAFNEYAVQAFEVNALDYLLKPFDEERLSVAIRKARQQLNFDGAQRVEFEQRMYSAFEQLHHREYTDRLAIKDDDHLFLLDVEKIDWIEAAGKYVRLHVGETVHLLREPLKDLESRLDPRKFARIHRSTIVNLDSVQVLEPMFHGEYSIRMKDGTQLTLSRSYRSKLRERFGNSI